MVESAMKRARIMVAEARLPDFFLPPRYRDVWATQPDHFGKVEVVIDGPFPDAVEDGALISTLITQHVRDGSIIGFSWQWVTFETWAPLGDPITWYLA